MKSQALSQSYVSLGRSVWTSFCIQRLYFEKKSSSGSVRVKTVYFTAKPHIIITHLFAGHGKPLNVTPHRP